MAIIHQASLTPSKLEILRDYLPQIPALDDYVDQNLEHIGAYRFDDPEGHVGVETHVLSGANGAVLQMPLTYRNEALVGAEPWLVGTMHHSVLGDRWVYHGAGDPVYVGELLRTIMSGGSEVAEIVETQDGPVPRDSSFHVQGSGSDEPIPSSFTWDAEIDGTETVLHVRDEVFVHEIVVRHLLSSAAPDVETPRLSGQAHGVDQSTLLAYLR